MTKHALVVDDEKSICDALAALLQDLGCDVTTSANAEQALEHIGKQSFDVIVLDVRLPGIDGIEALPQIKELTDAPVLLITAHGDLSTAVSAVELGVFEYLPKPFDLDQITSILRRALADSNSSRTKIGSVSNAKIVGNSGPMQQLFRQIALAAQHNEPVLITGESGTGKELIAHAIHEHSQRREQPIVPVHLASLSEALMERELFGHVAGAYTGAAESQFGLIARSNGGTLFLDEIGETPMPVQVKLLRTIETGEYYRVGSSTTETSDFRLIAATNRPTDYLRSSDEFRHDLFYRLSTIHIHVPPLRDRAEDIPALANHLLRQSSANADRELSTAAISRLQAYDFPGNVRELKNIVLRAAAQSSEQSISADFIVIHEPGAISAANPTTFTEAARAWAARAIASGEQSILISASEIMERELIAAAMEHCKGNRTAAAALLGIHRETLRDKISRLNPDE